MNVPRVPLICEKSYSGYYSSLRYPRHSTFLSEGASLGPTKSLSTVAYLITIGLVSILGQVVILRELNVAFYGIELIYILSLGFWLLGTAIGAAAGRRSGAPGEGRLQSLLILMAVVLPADIIFIRDIRRIFGSVPGGYLPFELQIVGLIAAIIPLSLLTGISFQATARRYFSEGGSLARAYAIESAGGVIGGLLSTLLLAFGYRNLSAGLFCSALALCIVFLFSWKKKMRLQNYLSAGSMMIVLAMLGIAGRIDRLTTSWNHPNMLESVDTPYGRVTVTAREKQICVFENDALSYETETTAAEEFVQLSTLQATELRKVLVLGGGFEGIVTELLKLQASRIDYVEINKMVIQTVAAHLPQELRAPLHDKRVRIFYADPRKFSGTGYDMILVAMPEPMSAQNNRFYTKEFFEKCYAELAPDGTLAFAIPSAENLWTPQLQNRNAGIYAALKSVFRNVIVTPGVTNIFMASNADLSTDTGRLIKRFKDRRVATRLVSPEYINYLYTNDRFIGINKVMSTGTRIPNTDIQPACYGYTISMWLSRFFGSFTLPDARSFELSGIMSSPAFWLMIIVALTVAINGKLLAARQFLLMLLAGAVGMVTETVLLLNYQSRNGVLYQDIGVLLMTFMAGLGLGAFIIDKVVAGRHSAGQKHTWLKAALTLGFGVLNAVACFAIASGLLDGLRFTSLMLALDGMLVSAIFAVISLSSAGERQKAMTWLYSADLIGGTVGSLTAILFLIPVFGMLTTSVVAAAAAVAGLAFLR